MGGKLWTAAGIYASWRLILKPVLKAGALLTRAGIILPVAIARDVSQAVTVTHQPRPSGPRRWDGTGRPASQWPRPKSPVSRTSPASAKQAPEGTGDWRQDKETLRRLIAEGQIRTRR